MRRRTLFLAAAAASAIGGGFAAHGAPTPQPCRDTLLAVSPGSAQVPSCADLEKLVGFGLDRPFWSCSDAGTTQIEFRPGTPASIYKNVSKKLEKSAGPFGVRMVPDLVLSGAQAPDPTGRWGLDRIDQRRPSSGGGLVRRAGTGKGVTVYLLDSGVYVDHPDLRGRVTDGGRFNTCLETVNGDCLGHGTHMAGLIAGTETGVAPEAEVVSLTVVDTNNETCLSHVLEALDVVTERVRERRDEGAVVNMSLQCGTSACAATVDGKAALSLLRAKEAELRGLGVLTVVSAGNAAGPDQVAPFGDLRDLDGALVVGRLNASDAFVTVAGADLYAPGEAVRTTSRRESDYETSEGTSPAAALVSGAVAVDLANSLREERGLTSVERATRVRQRLIDRATHGGGVLCTHACPDAPCPESDDEPTSERACTAWESAPHL